MPMTRDEQDAFDRRMAGIMDPMLRPEGTAGGPVRSYSLDDIRRFLGFGSRPAMSPAEVADAAQMYERLPNPALPPTPPGGYDAPSPSIPYMPSTDPRGAAAPIPPPPRPAAPARPRAPAPRLTNMQGAQDDMLWAPSAPVRPDYFGGVNRYDMWQAEFGQPAPPLPPNASALIPPAPVPSPVMDPIGPPPARPIAARGRPSPADLARALRESDERFARSTAQR